MNKTEPDPAPETEPTVPAEPTEPVAPERRVVDKVDSAQLQHFVTEIKSAEEQVGENIIRALSYDETVAVLTTVIVGPNGQQQVISAALNPSMMNEVREVLRRAQEEREPEEPCIGFHCLVKLKNKDKKKEGAAPPSSSTAPDSQPQTPDAENG